MARAETYGDIARLEQLLDEHANIAALDLGKLPAIRQQIWTLMRAAKMDHDLGLAERPEDDSFDDMLLHVDGWLCEIKDVQIRDGLHVLGQAPTGASELDLVLSIPAGSAVVRRRAVPARPASGPRTGRRRQRRPRDGGRGGIAGSSPAGRIAGPGLGFAAGARSPPIPASPRFCDSPPTRWYPSGRHRGEIDQVLRALGGRYIPAGPSGSPLRGLVNVLPTGRNFYSVDPKAVPSRLAWETGVAMADSLLARYRADHGDWPRSVGLSVWGTSAMRTSGDDIAKSRAALCPPIWDDASRRVVDLEAMTLEELGRPRIDVTVRISGFFRDAFPHVVTMLDDAVQLVAGLDESSDMNFLRAPRLLTWPYTVTRDVLRQGFRVLLGTYGAGAPAADRQQELARRPRSGAGVHRLGWIRLWA